MNDSARIKILQSVLARDLTPGQAAEILNVTPRHLSRLLKRYRESGPLGMNNRSRGKPSNSRLPVSLSTSILKIILEKYKDFGPTLVREKLDEIHGITVGKETIRRLMIAAGLWVPRKMRAPKIQQPRYRRACIGELIQIDGCDHEWFEDRASRCTLLVYVDDATSKLMHLRFVHCETTFTYFEATRGYLEKHGKPLALYSDRASVFRINNKNATGGDGHTQFGRAMHELNIQSICANSSQAKGRVERTHLTLQDRLVKELRLKNISSMDAANLFVEEFMDDYNRRFAIPPRESFDVHRQIEDVDDLDNIFTLQELRKVSFLIVDTEVSRRAIGKDIELWQYLDGYLELRMNNVFLSCRGYLNGGQICINSLTSRDDSLKFISRIFKRIEKAKARFNNLHGRSYNVIL
ncbi:ISNCY family transposase [Salmonella enterica]|nr:ISNCY family transposase [Salmonella enterica]EIO9437564.1 ISNCY family transposase [Salmonella enterica]